MPPEQVPQAGLSQSQPHSHKNIYLMIAIGVVLVVLILGAAWYFLLPHSKSGNTLPGTVLLYLPAGSSTQVGGLVRYSPTSDSTSPLVDPEVPVIPIALSTAMTPSGDRVMGYALKDHALLKVDTTKKSPVVIVQPAAVNAAVFGSVISPDGQVNAYLVVPYLSQYAKDHPGDFTTKGATSTLKADVQLPEKYQPRIAIVGPDIKATVKDGSFPLVLSQDKQRLLVANGSTYSIVEIRNGSSTPLRGDFKLTGQNARSLRVSPDTSHIAVVQDDTAYVYALDWKNATVSQIGTINGVSQVAFSTQGDLLVLRGDTAESYAFGGSTLTKAQSYALHLPQGASLLSWISS